MQQSPTIVQATQPVLSAPSVTYAVVQQSPQIVQQVQPVQQPQQVDTYIPPFHLLQFSNCLSIQVVLLQSAPTITAAAPAAPAVVQLTPSYSTVSVQQQADVGFVSADDPDGNTFHYHVHVANLDDAAGVQDAINDYGQPQQIQAAPVRPVYRPKKQR